MSQEATATRKNDAVPDPVRTVRVSDELWQAAQDRAWERREKEGVAAPLRLALRAWVTDPDAFEAACRQIVGETA